MEIFPSCRKSDVLNPAVWRVRIFHLKLINSYFCSDYNSQISPKCFKIARIWRRSQCRRRWKRPSAWQYCSVTSIRKLQATSGHHLHHHHHLHHLYWILTERLQALKLSMRYVFSDHTACKRNQSIQSTRRLSSQSWRTHQAHGGASQLPLTDKDYRSCHSTSHSIRVSEWVVAWRHISTYKAIQCHLRCI